MSNSEGYRIVRQVGNGLTGPVFLAEAPSGQVAVRQFQSRSEAGSEEWLSDLQHFLRGGRQAAQLHHARIVETFEVIDEGADAYIASEFVAAETCETLLARESLTPEQANYVLRLIAIALDYAHQNEVTHGDLKPSNIFMLPMRAIKIGDFAISPRARRLTGPIPDDLTHPYLSPEHLSAPETIGPRSDQYALAAIAWHLYTGSPPLPNFRQARTPIPKAIEAVLLRALSRDPGDRYVSCLQFVDALEAGLITAPQAALVEKKTSKLIYAAVGGVAALLLLVALLLSAPNRADNKFESRTPLVSPKGPAFTTGTKEPENFSAGDQTTYKKPNPAVNSPEPAQNKVPVQTQYTAPTAPPQRNPPVEIAGIDSKSASLLPPQAASMELVLYSRQSKIEPGASFSYRDPELGEMAHGDLTAVVQTTGPLLKGKLTLEWALDDIPMGAPQIVIPNKAAQYGNEPTPGQYRITLRLNGATLKTSTFRITK